MDASASVKCPSACHSGSLMAFQSMKRGNTRGGLLAGPPGGGGGGTKVPGKEPRVRNRRLELSCQLVLLYDLEPSLSLAEPHFPHVDSEAAGPVDSQGPTSSVPAGSSQMGSWGPASPREAQVAMKDQGCATARGRDAAIWSPWLPSPSHGATWNVSSRSCWPPGRTLAGRGGQAPPPRLALPGPEERFHNERV